MVIRNEVFRGQTCLSADIIDLEAGTIAQEVNGAIVSTRALTPDEATRYTPVAPELSPGERLVAARVALSTLDTTVAPYTTADIVDVLLDVKTALGG